MCKRTRTTRSSPRGVALLLVLGMIMAITILALGFIARCDTELAAGQNMAVRMQMDQLATSGLEHARGLLLNPQEVPSVYWTGEVRQQLGVDSPDFYDVAIVLDDSDPNDFCTYEITSTAYRERTGQRTGESRLEATLRLDPAVALWTAADLDVRTDWIIYGDVRSAARVRNEGTIRGDIFASDLIGAITGACKSTDDLKLLWPMLASSYSHPDYAILPIGPGAVSGTYGSPAVWRCNGNLLLDGAVVVNGMLLVNGNVTIQGSGARLTAAKNLPAVYVTGNLVLDSATDSQIVGLVVVDGHVLIGHDTDVRIVGGLFAQGEIAEATVDSSAHASGAILRNITTWPGGGALALDGVNQYVQTPDDDTHLQLTGDYTLSVWIKPAAIQKPWAGILCKANIAGDRNHWVLQFNSMATELIVGHDTARWSTDILLGELTDGLWHHVAVVRQGNTMKSYLDGTERATGTMDTLPRNGGGHLNIGADRTGSSTYVYKGLLDDVRVYNRALTAVEVAGPPTDESLIGHWTFDATSCSQVRAIADPLCAAIVIGDGAGAQHWSPAAGAFFRSVRRPQP
ncbi:MAG: LamG domain-containing protein [Planctomycetota bacterium]|nr:LamG domain-containing protein [Planctomycetota bacterium]